MYYKHVSNNVSTQTVISRKPKDPHSWYQNQPLNTIVSQFQRPPILTAYSHNGVHSVPSSVSKLDAFRPKFCEQFLCAICWAQRFVLTRITVRIEYGKLTIFSTEQFCDVITLYSALSYQIMVITGNFLQNNRPKTQTFKAVKRMTVLFRLPSSWCPTLRLLMKGTRTGYQWYACMSFTTTVQLVSIKLVVVHRVCLDSWWSDGEFSRQV